MNDDVEMAGQLKDGAPCNLSIKDSRIEIKIDYSDYDPLTFFDKSALPDNITVSLNNGKIAELKNVYMISSNGTFGHGRTVKAGANLAIIGGETFPSERKVDALCFTPSSPLVAIHYTGHRSFLRSDSSDVNLATTLREYGERYSVSVLDNDKLTAATAVHGGLEVELKVGATTNMSQQGTEIVEDRRALLSYGDGEELNEVIGDALDICDFMSLLTGTVIGPTSYKIISGERDKRGIRPTFDLYVRARKNGPDRPPNAVFGLLSTPAYDGARYASALSVWIARRHEWRQSNRLFIDVLQRKSEISRTRFLDAMGWFESIPDSYLGSCPNIDKAHLQAAAVAASAALSDAGEDVSAKRIMGLLYSLNTPSLGMRLKAAVAHIRSRFDDDILPADADETLGLATKIRGRFAHGENAFLGPEGGRIYEVTMLIEAVAALLTLADLDIARERLKPQFHHWLTEGLMEVFDMADARRGPMEN